MSFENLNLNTAILKAIADTGYTEPTPIQAQAIPEVMAGNDLMASSQTGSGKTAAFILPILNRLATPSALPGLAPRFRTTTWYWPISDIPPITEIMRPSMSLLGARG